MRRGMVVLAVVIPVLAGIAIGVGAYNAGVDEGIRRGVESVESGAQVVEVVGHPGGYGFFPGLFLFPLLLLFGGLLLVKALLPPRWYGPGHGPWGRGHDEHRARFEARAREWHRHEHDQAGDAAEGSAQP